jgi:hypothetical protein
MSQFTILGQSPMSSSGRTFVARKPIVRRVIWLSREGAPIPGSSFVGRNRALEIEEAGVHLFN